MGLKAQNEGKAFEQAFATLSKLCGYTTLKIPEMGRWIGPGTFRPIAGWADFVLIDINGRTAWIDAKSTANEVFAFSLINQEQVRFFEEIGDKCHAGYVVYYRALNTVVFHNWMQLKKLGTQESLKPSQGVELGKIPDIKVQKIFASAKVTMSF